MQHIPTWAYIAVCLFSFLTGFLSAAALFYPVGRRHGIQALADHWKGVKRDDEVAKIARNAGAKVRGPNQTTDTRT